MSKEANDRIMQLCAKAVAATDPSEVEKAIKELNNALSEHTRLVRQRIQAERERSAP